MLYRTVLLQLLAVLLLAVIVHSEKYNSRAEWQEKVHNIKAALKQHPEEVEKWLAKWEDVQERSIEIPEFTCDVQPGDPATSVHELRPGDIKVIAAFGDSVTSGNGVGADTLPGVAIENRGESWSIGVNDTIETVLTLANLIREFNPDLVGGSYSRPGRDDDRNRTHCSEIMECAQFNVAVPGATNRDMVEQAFDLIEKMNNHPDVDMANDWKLVTLFIGGNDLCAVCRRWDDYNPQNYLSNIRAAMETIQANVPRVLFQVVTMFDITPLANMSDGIVCDIAQMGFCDCALYNDSTKAIVKNSQMEYWRLLDELINVNGTYDGDDSFTVVLQPHMRDLLPPVTEDGEWDKSYMAPDCFHPGLKGHQMFAYQLWNIMLTPVQDKPFLYPSEESMAFNCPTQEAPYIFTNDNSRSHKKNKIQTHKRKHFDSIRQWNKDMKKFYSWLDSKPKLKEDWIKEWRKKDEGITPPPFNCDIDDGGLPPQSVHELRPSDIDVIGAFGDSVTAGYGIGAETVEEVGIQNRGESWTAGGNKSISEVLTIANLLTEFNPNLMGWSYNNPGSNNDTEGTGCGRNDDCARLNVAVGGATSPDLISQAETMVERLQDNPEIDLDNDWKLMSLFIGGNDLCRVCYNDDLLPEYYLSNIKETIDIIKVSVPRVLMQVIIMFDVSPVKNMSTGPVCDSLQLTACSCAIREETRPMLKPIQMEYWRLLDELINVNGTYNGDSSFTVVLQPHLRDLTPPIGDDGDWDKSFFAPDCFHPNRKGHQYLAYQLWNVMLTPVGEKPYFYPLDDEEDMVYKCPNENAPFIFTNENSIQKEKVQKIEQKSKPIKEKVPAFDSVKEWKNSMNQLKSWLDDHRDLTDKIEKRDDPGIVIPPFECDIVEADPTTSVHALRPGNIDVVAALGDSITAGFGIGAETIAEVGTQKRGESWSVGGNGTINTVLTIGNLLRQFNPNLVGWSYNRPGLGGDSNDTGCSRTMQCAQLNVALGGATNLNVPSQAELLVEKMMDHADVDMENHWKLVTLLIGGNDLCRVCTNDNFLPETYLANVKEAIDIIKENIPRTLVQVVNMFDISPLKNMSTGPACDAAHIAVCNCAIDEETRPMLRPIQMEYWRLLDELINVNGTYNGDDSFAVVLQPHMRDLTPPVGDDGDWDRSFFAPDCFHPNRKGHQHSAYQLWNAMLTAVPDKPYFYPRYDEEDMEFRCPTDNAPYIFTNENSIQKEKVKKIEQKSKPIKEKVPAYDSVKEWKKSMDQLKSWLDDHRDLTDKIEKKDDPGIVIPPFECDVVEADPATSVHALRPGNIDVVAALGDSVTAGFGIGAETIAEVGTQKRGESWSVGGNGTINTVLTIGTLLRQFNPHLVGWSYNRPGLGGDSNDTGCSRTMECAQLNVALGGATNLNVPSQAEMLVEKMMDHPDVDLDNHWKLVTLLIGGNDLCRVCNNDNFLPETYLANVKEAIDIIKENIPRALVQVVNMFDISPLKNQSTGPACDAAHIAVCNCAIDEETRPILRPIQMEYWRLLDELININGTYNGDDSFTVVLQPHMRDLTPPIGDDGDWDRSFFAPDCFHPNRKGHQHLAYQLWTAMLTPVPDKPYVYSYDGEDMEFRCPTEEAPYIFTNDNSQRKQDSENTKGKPDSDDIHVKEWDDQLEYERRWEEVMAKIEETAGLLDRWENSRDSTLDDDLIIPPFLCDVNDLPTEPATNVHELKPSDIKIITSFGDSITAGNGLGAETKPGVAIENRGESWSIGGNQTIETVLTVPNLIKEYNPNLVGWSWSRYSRLDRNETHCDENMNCSQLNVASPGATNRGMAGQAQSMIDRMLDDDLMDGEVDFENDWKMTTLFIGGNDLCRVCENSDSYGPDAYRDGVRDALDILHQQVPRMLVNLVIMFDVSPLTNMSTGPVCDALHWGFCNCAVNETTRKELRGIQLEYYNKLQELVDSGRYDTRDDFTVVIQPHQRDIEPILDGDGNIDHSYFSPDCFHPSRKGHQGFAYMLWNVMLMPVGQKPFKYDAYEEQVFRCPCQDHPYIFTNLNSDVDWSPCVVDSKSNKHIVDESFTNRKVKIPGKPELFASNDQESGSVSKPSVHHVYIVAVAGIASVAAVGLLALAVVMQYIKAKKKEEKSNKSYKQVLSFENPTFDESP